MKKQEIKEKVAEISTLLSQSNTRDAKIILNKLIYNHLNFNKLTRVNCNVQIVMKNEVNSIHFTILEFVKRNS